MKRSRAKLSKINALLALGIVAAFHALMVRSFAVPTDLLFQEKFEDTNFAARGWYDNTRFLLSTNEQRPGSARSAEFFWRRGGTTPSTGGAFRRKFAPTESVYVSYWVKYSTNYAGSNRPYHPHEFLVMTTKNGDWDGPAFTRLTAYIEHNEGRPLLAIQDGQNIDQTRINQDLTALTENRSVAGCNGVNADGYTGVDCYRSGTSYWNGKIWKTGQIYFQDAPGRYYKSDWHHVEAFFKLNSISGGKGVPDGQVKYWFDGELLIESTNVLMRTGAHPDMKWNQFMIAPYIGDGAPVEQSMWLDDLLLAGSRPLADADSDGMPDEWEIAHALNPGSDIDAGEDPDEDHFSNLSEYIAGTNPRNESSALRIISVTLTNDVPRIEFETVAGKTYDLQFSPQLRAAPWTSVAPRVGGTGGALHVSDSASASQSERYYRIKL